MLSNQYQFLNNLLDRMALSDQKEGDQNERDKTYYTLDFHKAIADFGYFFKEPILADEDRDKDIDCLEVVKEVLPQLSKDAVTKFASVLGRDGVTIKDKEVCQILRRYHSLRFR